jgi:hypothetical protein
VSARNYEEKAIPERKEHKLTLKEYVELAISQNAKCFECGRPAEPETIDYWAHSAGWRVEGFKALQWLSFECAHCGYGTSFTKLRIARPEPHCA